MVFIRRWVMVVGGGGGRRGFVGDSGARRKAEAVSATTGYGKEWEWVLKKEAGMSGREGVVLAGEDARKEHI